MCQDSGQNLRQFMSIMATWELWEVEEKCPGLGVRRYGLCSQDCL
jgi:hypothetical protein